MYCSINNVNNMIYIHRLTAQNQTIINKRIYKIYIYFINIFAAGAQIQVIYKYI